MVNVIKIDDKSYVRIGDKLVEIAGLDEKGNPILSVFSTEVRHDDGRVDCTVHVPCLQIASKANVNNTK